MGRRPVRERRAVVESVGICSFPIKTWEESAQGHASVFLIRLKFEYIALAPGIPVIA
jgi:hypothetical protein